MKTVDHFVPKPASERDLIRLVSRLWEIECVHLLGAISTQEYRQRVAAMLQSGENVPVDDGVFGLS